MDDLQLLAKDADAAALHSNSCHEYITRTRKIIDEYVAKQSKGTDAAK